MAVPVEDHTLEAGVFEGVHPGARRGTGAVIIWDEGTADITRDEPGHLSFVAHGTKLAGGFALDPCMVSRRWVLVKVRDEHARHGRPRHRPAQYAFSPSVRSGRTWQDRGLSTPRQARRVSPGVKPVTGASGGLRRPGQGERTEGGGHRQRHREGASRAGLGQRRPGPRARAARSHRSQASEPVTHRFGPRLSPTSREKG